MTPPTHAAWVATRHSTSLRTTRSLRAGRSSPGSITRSTSITSLPPITTPPARAYSPACATGTKAMRWAIANLAWTALLTACTHALAGSVVAEDATGAAIELAAPASRIVSLAPHATELLFAAGAGDRIVGVLAPADWPPEAARLVQVGTVAGLDLERIIAL